MFLCAVLLIIISAAIAAEQAGLSMALGAFLAGLLFAETEYRHAIEVDIEPFKGLLLGLFFVSVGMHIDLGFLGASPGWLAVSVIGLFAIKGAILYGLARLFKRPHTVALECALLLGQGGEFTFLIIGFGFAAGLIAGGTAQFMLIVTGLTILATPFVALGARRLARFQQLRADPQEQDNSGLSPGLMGHTIVVGYGRVGQMLGSILDAQGLPHVALDMDTNLVAGYSDAGGCVFYGDARQPDVLSKVGVERAGALVVTMDSPRAAERVVETVHGNWPRLAVYARARDGAHASRLFSLGAHHVVPETVEASLELSEIVLTGAGVPGATARQLIEQRRQAEQAALDESRGGESRG